MKRTFFSLLSIPLLLLSLGAFTACADWTDDDGSSALAKTNDDAPLLIKQAQCLIGDGAVSTVDIHSGDHVPAASHRKTRAARTCETFEVDWSDYRMIHQFGQEVAIIPLTRKSQTAYIELTERGRTKKSVNKVSSRLIVRYDSLNHRPVAVVGTYVYDKNYASRHKNVTDMIGFDFRNTDYTGYFVTSRLDGTMLAGTRYVKGQEQFRFEANPIPPEERDTTDVDEDLHLYLDLHSVRMQTRGVDFEYDLIEDADQKICSFCGKTYAYCQCADILNCKTCHKRKSECTCDPNDQYCRKCNQKIENGRCDCCQLCHNYPCSCNSSSGSGNQGSGGTSSGGGSSTGGGSSSGGPVPGGGSSSSNKPTQDTKPSYVTTTAKITTACKNAIQDVIRTHGRSNKACNVGVRNAFINVFGSNALPSYMGMHKFVNDMASGWANNPQNWQEISLEETQDYANKGYFVVAGYYNPKQGGNGHVVVIVPGKMEPSDAWECDVPHCMDTGPGRRTDNKKLSFSFTPDLKDKVHYYFGSTDIVRG